MGTGNPKPGKCNSSPGVFYRVSMGGFSRDIVFVIVVHRTIPSDSPAVVQQFNALSNSIVAAYCVAMKLEALHVGMRIKHAQYGVGTVRSISEHAAEIRFDDQQRTISPEHSNIEPAEAQAEISGLNIPLSTLIAETVHRLAKELKLEREEEMQVVEQLGTRWRNGTLVLKPSDSSLQPKEVPLETFFHKIVMVRNNLRVLEQKINAHPQLSDAEKFDMQQYITRSYGSMTTFNVLFKEKDDQFSSKA